MSSPCSTFCTTCRFGMPRAWYCRQSQSDQGDSRPICQRTVRSQKTRSSCSALGSSRTTENATSVAARKPMTNRKDGRRPGYVAQSGATISDANFVQPESAAKIPRAAGRETSQKPQMRNAGMIASFVFEFDAYCVNGYAAHANASVAPNGMPPKRRPTSQSPRMQSRSKAIAVKCDAGSESHLPLQPKNP